MQRQTQDTKVEEFQRNPCWAEGQDPT